MSKQLKLDTVIGGRSLKIWQLAAGGYRYETTALSDEDPTHEIETASFSTSASVLKGQPFEDVVDDLAGLQEQLVEVGFSSSEAKQACAQVTS